MLKKFLSVVGLFFSIFILLISLILFAVGISENETSMAICGLGFSAVCIFGCVRFSKKIPKKEKIKKEVSATEPKTLHTPEKPVQKFKKTITCKTCGVEISPRAKRCPHCGEMTPGEMVSQTAIGCIVAPFIAILIFIAIGFYLGSFSFFANM